MHTEQKVWSNWSLRQQNYLNYRTFTEYFVITSFSYYYFSYFWHVAMLQKFAGPLVGAPVRPNMLNMPKSTSGELGHHGKNVCRCAGLWSSANWDDLAMSYCGWVLFKRLSSPNWVHGHQKRIFLTTGADAFPTDIPIASTHRTLQDQYCQGLSN